MKKILNIFGIITLTSITNTSIVSCNNKLIYSNKKELKEEELTKLKEENKINTTNKQIKDNLEWITPQEKPFNKIDNKHYYVVWRGNNNIDWRINKFKNNKEQREKQILENYKNFRLIFHNKKVLYIIEIGKQGIPWNKENFNYFKSVYRWKLDTPIPIDNIITDNKGNIKIN